MDFNSPNHEHRRTVRQNDHFEVSWYSSASPAMVTITHR